jgi:hypothetical protein
MRKLKVGDKVKINEIGILGCVNKIGDIGVITVIDALGTVRVKVGNLVSDCNWSKLSDLELIKNKMNKHKKFIKDAYNGKKGLTMCSQWKEAIEESYPEFKPESKLKVGEWYKRKGSKSIFKITKHIEGEKYNGYGLNTFGSWFGKNVSGFIYSDTLHVLATEEEVKEALVNQCKQLGIWEVPVKCLLRFTNREKARFDIQFNDNRLWSTYGVVFEDGVFAEPLPVKKQMTVLQLEEELGYEIEIIK